SSAAGGLSHDLLQRGDAARAGRGRGEDLRGRSAGDRGYRLHPEALARHAHAAGKGRRNAGMSRRLTILAGGGALVPEVLGAAKASGDEIQVLPLVDRSDLGFSEVFGAADLPRLIWRITSFRTTHITMIGGLRATTGDRENFKRFAGSKSGLNGDSTLLTIAEKILAVTGAKVVGAEAIAPAILAQDGLIAGPSVGRPTLALARFALEKARAVGALDIGQAVVAAPGRIL